MAATPLDKTEAILADRVATDLPTRLGQAATPDRAVTVAGLVVDPEKMDGCNPRLKDVTKLPTTMDRNGFDRGAKLLRKWLSLDVSVKPKYAAIDTTTITMDFVLTHPRAKRKFDKIFSEKTYVNEAARSQISTLLKRLGKDQGGQFDFNRPVEQLAPGPEPIESFTVQRESVGYSLTDPIDSLTASLGEFLLKVVNLDPPESFLLS